MIELDGAQGEGGGQVLRTALGLSLVTGRPLSIHHIRARRPKPGLRPQHCTAVSAAARIGGARVDGNRVGSTSLRFEPSGIYPGEHHFDIGTAGSTSLVLQTLLPALMLADSPSRIQIRGGTHNPLAPTYDFLERAFLPLVSRMGPRITARLTRPGFFPAGGGEVVFEIEPAPRLTPLTLLERGAPTGQRACALVAKLPRHVAERELDVIAERLSFPRSSLELVQRDDVASPGNALEVSLGFENLTEHVTELGRRGLPAERVADAAANAALGYLDSHAVVGAHLADQLLVPFALAGAGEFRTLTPTLHTTTNAEVIRAISGVEFSFESEADGSVRVRTLRS